MSSLLHEKSFGGLSLLACLVLLAVGSGPWTAQGQTQVKRRTFNHPFLKSWYGAEQNRPLATWSGGTLTERDLLLLGMMTRAKDPAIFHTWSESRRAKRRERLTKDLEDALLELALTLTLAERSPARTPTPTDEKFIRYLKYPIYQWVWIEEVLRLSFDPDQIDMVKYYHDHVEEFYQPEAVRVRYIFREVSPSATIAQRDALEAEMNELRREIVGGGDFVELARAESDAASAVRGGELPLIERGMFLEEFESQAFALAPGEVGPVFRGPGGFYFIQCLEKFEEKQQTYEEAQEKLREEVEHQTLRFLYNHRLNVRLRRRDYRNRSFIVNELPPDQSLVIVGDYELSKNELLRLFPSAIADPLELQKGIIARIANDIQHGELVAQEVEKLGLHNHALLVAADQMARKMWRANVALREAMHVPLEMTEAELMNYFERNRDELGYQPQWHVLLIEAAVRNPYLRHPSQVPALQGELRAEFEAALDEFQMSFREERAATAGHLTLAGEQPETSLNAALIPDDEAATETARFRRYIMELPRSLVLLTETSTPDYVYTVTDLGFVDHRTKSVYHYIKNLEEGEYSPIASTDEGVLRTRFVVRYIPGAPAEYTDSRVHIREQYIAHRQAGVFLRMLEELEAAAALSIRLPEIAGQER